MINMKIESLDDLIVAFGYVIEAGLEADFVPNLSDIHEAFEAAFDDAIEAALDGDDE